MTEQTGGMDPNDAVQESVADVFSVVDTFLGKLLHNGAVSAGQRLEVALQWCDKTGNPYPFEGHALKIRLASKAQVQVGDKVLAVMEPYISRAHHMELLDPCVKLFTMVKSCEDGRIPVTMVKDYEDGRIPIVASKSLPVSRCFKVLNPEVLAQ